MDFLSGLPVWAGAAVIVLLRVCDVSLGTLRTIAVVQGRLKLSVLLGFLEVTIWFTAVAQALQGIGTSPLMALAYAVGYAAGNAVGITLDRWLALGSVEVRWISRAHGPDIARALRELGRKVTTFVGEGRDGPSMMVYAICPRRRLRGLITTARRVDPNAIYTVDPIHEHGDAPMLPLPHPTGWRAWFHRK